MASQITAADLNAAQLTTLLATLQIRVESLQDGGLRDDINGGGDGAYDSIT